MNLNIISYLIYLMITIFIIIRVGKICYRNGNVFVSELTSDHKQLCEKVNQVLLLAYYLLNIGYCTMTLIQWQKIQDIVQLVETVALRTAVIICIISLLHYMNIFIITKYIQKLISTT